MAVVQRFRCCPRPPTTAPTFKTATSEKCDCHDDIGSTGETRGAAMARLVNGSIFGVLNTGYKIVAQAGALVSALSMRLAGVADGVA